MATFFFQIIDKSPTILDDMIHCLGVNQLTSPSTSAFKAFLEWERYTLILVKPVLEYSLRFSPIVMVTLQETFCGTCCMHGVIFKQLKSCVTSAKAAIN